MADKNEKPVASGYPSYSDVPDWSDRAYEEHGMKPGWKGVWVDGVDISESVPPEDWPWPYNPDAPRPKRNKRAHRGTPTT